MVVDPEVVEDVWRDLECGRSSHALIAQEPGIQAVEPDGLIARRCQKGRPGRIIALRTIGACRLDHEQFRSVPLPVGALQDLVFSALCVDFQKMDVLTRGMRVEHLGQGADLDFACLHPQMTPLRFRWRPRLQGRGAKHGIVGMVHVESEAALSCTERELQIDIARALMGESWENRTRLDVDAAPASFVERPGDGIDIRLPRPDIDIEAGLDVAENATQHHVLEVLSVADEAHIRSPQVV